LGPCHVAPDALQGIKRQQTNPARWSGPNWEEFAAAVRARGIELLETAAARAAFATDAGGTAYGLAHGVVLRAAPSRSRCCSRPRRSTACRSPFVAVD